MAMSGWLRALDTISGLLEFGRRFTRPRGDAAADFDAGSSGEGITTTSQRNAIGAPGTLEARLAGVLVAALKEAFDRDRTRLELEQAQLEAERRRAEDAMRL